MSNRNAWRMLVVALVGALTAFSVSDPMTDRAGPVTVRIQGPRDVTRTGVPIPVGITLENSGRAAVHGTVRLHVIDGWSAEPREPVSVDIPAQGRGRVGFTVTVAEGAFNATYPVHAIAEFDSPRGRQAAHPILTVQVRTPDPPAVRLPVEWKPLTVPESGAMGLWRLPVRRTETRVVEQELWVRSGSRATTQSVEGAIEFGVGVARGDRREGLAMRLGTRPPTHWLSVAEAIVEYPLALPKAHAARLRFATALSDGVDGEPIVFRVRAIPFSAAESEAPVIVFERRGSSPKWEEGEADLSRFAGQAMRLQLECASGRSRAATGYWAEPAVITGKAYVPKAFPPPDTAGSRLLGVIERQDGRYEVRIWPGHRGVLDAAIGFAGERHSLYLRGFQVQVLGDALESPLSGAELVSAREEPASKRYRVRHRFRSWAGEFDLTAEMWIEKAALYTRFAIEDTPPPRPWLSIHLEDVAAGPWSEHATRIYAGPGNVIEEPKAFRLKANGHYMATSYVGYDFANGMAMLQAVDVPPDHLGVDPDTRSYSLHTPHAQTMVFIPSGGVWEAAKTWREIHDTPAAGGVAKLAGRFVFDLWSGRYAETAAALRKAFRYGISDAVVIFHRWQRWGYDYRLPDIYPPNSEWGTVEEFQELAATCRKHNVLFAPHDNYMDFYPDSEGFTYDNIALTADKQPQTAWLQGSIPSYHPRSDRVLPFVRRNIRLIKDGFAPGAYFIDVWSSEPPYDYYTPDGQFRTRVHTRDIWREGFAWIRNYLGENAPQLSEAGMDQYIGYLDGGTAAQMRVEGGPRRSNVWQIENQDTERIPWFDMAYHDRCILHGAGYEGRYNSGQDPRSHGIYSDDYMTMEVLTGHPAMVSLPFGRDVVRKYWLLNELARGLGLKRMETFEFAGGDLHRQRVRWEGGGQVWVNRGREEWIVADHVLPEYGYYARVPAAGGVVESAIERREGQIVEWSRSTGFLYVNARPVVRDDKAARLGLAFGQSPDPRPARMNPQGKAVSIGAVTTNGGFQLERRSDGATLMPLPGSTRFEVRIRWGDLPWKSAEPSRAEALDENGAVMGPASLVKQAGELKLTCDPEVFGYRLR